MKENVCFKKSKRFTPRADLNACSGAPRFGFTASDLGGRMGERFLLLNHIGWKSGQARQNVREVVRKDETGQAYIVASGFGEKSNWFQNVTAHPQVRIQVGRKQMNARAERLSLERATGELLDYNRRHPAALKTLAGMIGYKSNGDEADARFLATVIPLVSICPE